MSKMDTQVCKNVKKEEYLLEHVCFYFRKISI